MDLGQDVGRGVRAGRAAVFAAVCVLLASLGHVLVSGTAVPGCALLAALASAGSGAWWFADRERGRLPVIGATVGAQAGLHLLFSLCSLLPLCPPGPGAVAPRPAGGGRPWAELLLGGAHRAAPAQAAGLAEAADLAAVPGADLELGAHAHHAAAVLALPAHQGCRTIGMLTAHLLAALLVGLWLSAGERAVFRVGRTLAARLVTPALLILHPARPPHRPQPPRTAGADGARRLRRLLLVHAITSRGPPAPAAVR